MFVDMINWALR